MYNLFDNPAIRESLKQLLDENFNGELSANDISLLFDRLQMVNTCLQKGYTTFAIDMNMSYKCHRLMNTVIEEIGFDFDEFENCYEENYWVVTKNDVEPGANEALHFSPKDVFVLLEKAYRKWYSPLGRSSKDYNFSNVKDITWNLNSYTPFKANENYVLRTGEDMVITIGKIQTEGQYKMKVHGYFKGREVSLLEIDQEEFLGSSRTFQWGHYFNRQIRTIIREMKPYEEQKKREQEQEMEGVLLAFA